MNRMPLSVLVGLMLFASSAVGLAACGSPTTSTTTTTTSTTTTTAPSGRSTSTSLTSSGTFTAHIPGGYTASGLVQIGPPQSEADITTAIAGDLLGSACALNSQTDAAIPWTLTFTNTTAGFSFTSGGVQVDLLRVGYGPLDVPLDLSYEFDVGGQIQCANQVNGGNGGQDTAGWSLALTPQQRVILGGFIIVPNYFSPAQPHGDTSELSKAALGIQVASAGQDATYTARSGMKVLIRVPNDDEVYLPLPLR